MFDIALLIIALTGVIEMMKMAGLPSKVAPLTALFVGVTWMIFIGDQSTVENIFTGVMIALSASGLYSGVKTNLRK